MSHEVPVVFVVDDDISVRESLEGLILHEGWDAKLFETAEGFLSSPKPGVASCLILDVNLPDLNGLDVQQRIATDRSETPIIFLTGHGDVPMTVKAMKAGAAEFLTKPFDYDVLLTAIRGAIARSASALADGQEKEALAERYRSLSTREREVMELVVKGLLNKQVGGELGISEITVKAHRGRVMEKMQAQSFAELVTIAARLGISLPAQRPDAR
jgi:FixJ family two-component response regulator